MAFSIMRYSFFLLSLLLLSACQPKVYLMPAPIGIEPNGGFFLLSKENIDDNLLYTLYATNRIPFNKINDSIGYSIFPSDTLEMGFLVHSVGEGGMSWEELYVESLKKKRDKELLLTQIFLKPMVEYHKNDDLEKTSDRAAGFFDRLNDTLDKTFDKDITVYVHGANSNFYRATAQGAQLFHFTGHNSIILSFSWPSAENLLKYKTDVLHAKKTVPAFARLLEILALHTKARNINVIAYSAGAQVVAPGLAYLRDLYSELSSEELRQKLRLGEVYFAAPDTAFKSFTERYLKFRDMVTRTTISLNRNDRVLLFAAMRNGMSRLGRPDTSELDESETQIILKAIESVDLDVIDAGGSKALNIGKGHDYWYSHPWVSTDLLMLLIFNASPEERGLVEFKDEGNAIVYHFPDDYDARIQDLLKIQKEKMRRKNILHKEGSK